MLPQWLLPEARFVLYCSRVSLDDATQAELTAVATEKLNWEKVVSIASYHGTAPLLYFTIKRLEFLGALPPDSVTAILRNSFYENLSRNLKLWQEFCKIYDRFKECGIELIPMKGILFSRILYPSPGLRPIYSDIDILIGENDIASASRLLEEMGYGIYFVKSGYEKVFVKDSLMIDMHWHLVVPWLNRIKTKNLWQRGNYRLLDSRQMRLFSCEDTLLTLSLQLRYDLPTVKLFKLCDIHELLTQNKDSLDWDYLLGASRDYALAGPLLFSLGVCHNLFSSSLPGNALKKLAGRSAKKAALLLVSGKKTAGVFDRELKPKAGKFKKWFLKFLMVDNPADYAEILLHKCYFILSLFRGPSCRIR